MHVLYKLTFPNGKVYIGQAQKFKARMRGHKWRSENEKYISYNVWLYRAIRKYGWENVQKDIIMENVHEDMIDMLERLYIGVYKSIGICYNLESGGTTNKKCPTVSYHNRLTKSKVVLQVDIVSGDVVKEWESAHEVSRKLGIDRAHIAFICKKIEEKVNLGTGFGERLASGYFWIYKKDYSEKLVKKVVKAYHAHQKIKFNYCSVPILQISVDSNKVICRWDSIKSASRAIGVSDTLIANAVHGIPKRDGKGYMYMPKTAGGYLWKRA